MKIKPQKMNILKKLTKRPADLSNDGSNVIISLKNSILNMLRMVHRLLLIVYKLLIDSFLKYRIISLILSASLGIVLFRYMYYPPEVLTYYLPEWSSSFKNFWDKELSKFTRNSLSLLVLGLPTFFTLWVFRTHDAQRQIDNNTFFECARMLASEGKKVSKKMALEQLLYLRQKNPFYKERIDSLTQGIPLEKANLNSTQLKDINLSSADLTKAKLNDTDLTKAKLNDTDLTKADLIHVNLTKAKLNDTNLTDTDLTSANLTDTDLTGAKLIGAKLIAAKLINADLTGTNLYNTNLSGAKLYGTDLKKAKHYNTANFSGTRYDKNTKFPPDFDPKKASCIKE